MDRVAHRMNPVFAFRGDFEAGLGLSNQLNYLINGIIVAHLHRSPILLTEGFNAQFDDTHAIVPWSKVMDMDGLVSYVRNSLGVLIVDRHDCKCQLVTATYGRGMRAIDVLAKLTALMDDGDAHCHPQFDFNGAFGDPAPGYEKTLNLEYRIGTASHSIWLAHPESRNYAFAWDIGNTAPVWHGDMWGENYACPALYTDLLRAIVWRPEFFDEPREAPASTTATTMTMATMTTTVTTAAAAAAAIDTNIAERVRKRSVIHLRIETDACQEFGRRNGISSDDFGRRMHDTYLHLITKYCHPNEDELLILSGDGEDNPTSTALRELGFTVLHLHKRFAEREYNAIVDYLRTETCTGSFIGAMGSTFSALCARRLPIPGTQVALINANAIGTPFVAWKTMPRHEPPVQLPYQLWDVP